MFHRNSALRVASASRSIEGIVAVLEEGTHAPAAPLRDMVRDAGKDDAGQSGHASVAQAERGINPARRQLAPEWIGLGVYAPVTVISVV